MNKTYAKHLWKCEVSDKRDTQSPRNFQSERVSQVILSLGCGLISCTGMLTFCLVEVDAGARQFDFLFGF